MNRDNVSTYGGLFYTLSGSVKNLIIRNANIRSLASGFIAFSLLYTAQVSNVAIYDSQIYSNSNTIGGISGYNSGTISSCYLLNTTIKSYEDEYSVSYKDYYYIDLQFVSGRWVWDWGQKYLVTYKRAYYSKYHKIWRPNLGYSNIFSGSIVGENYGTIKYCYFEGDVSNSILTGERTEVYGLPISYTTQPEYWDKDSVKTHFGYDEGVTLINVTNIIYSTFYDRVITNSRNYIDSVADNRSSIYGNAVAGYNSGTIRECWYHNTTSASFRTNSGFNGNSFTNKSSMYFSSAAGFKVASHINNGYPHFKDMYWEDNTL